MVFGPGEDWYCKPDAGALIVSPAEEHPMDPHDAWADDMVLAEGLARYEEFVTEPVTRVISNWAGLRTFSPDRTLVIGRDPREPCVFLAGRAGRAGLPVLRRGQPVGGGSDPGRGARAAGAAGGVAGSGAVRMSLRLPDSGAEVAPDGRRHGAVGGAQCRGHSGRVAAGGRAGRAGVGTGLWHRAACGGVCAGAGGGLAAKSMWQTGNFASIAAWGGGGARPPVLLDACAPGWGAGRLGCHSGGEPVASGARARAPRC